MLTGVKTWTSEVLVLGSFKLWQRSKIDSNYKYFICFILNQKYKQQDKSNVKNVFLDMIKHVVSRCQNLTQNLKELT